MPVHRGRWEQTRGRNDRGRRSFRQPFRHLRARVSWIPGKDAAESGQRRTDRDAGMAKTKLADGIFMIAAALLHDRESAPHRSADFEIAQHEHGITQIADIESRLHRTDQPMLSED